MYKRSWNKKFGKSEIFKAEDSFCQKVEMDMLRLADGDSKAYREENEDAQLLSDKVRDTLQELVDTSADDYELQRRFNNILKPSMPAYKKNEIGD